MASIRAEMVMALAVLSAASCGPATEREAEAPSASGAAKVKAVWGGPGDPECAFPPEAETAKIDAGVVDLRVLVAADGTPEAAQTLEEPGFGFGPAATRCVMARKYIPAKDARGVAIRAWSPRIRIRFIR